jgi:hypothetical protein
MMFMITCTSVVTMSWSPGSPGLVVVRVAASCGLAGDASGSTTATRSSPSRWKPPRPACPRESHPMQAAPDLRGQDQALSRTERVEVRLADSDRERPRVELEDLWVELDETPATRYFIERHVETFGRCIAPLTVRRDADEPQNERGPVSRALPAMNRRHQERHLRQRRD